MAGFNQTKLLILRYLNDNGDGTAKEISEELDKTHTNIAMLLLSYHRWGMVRRSKLRGREFLYSLSDRGVVRLEWLEETLELEDDSL